jgi:hypothetical protein
MEHPRASAAAFPVQRKLSFEIRGRKGEGTLYVGAPTWYADRGKWGCQWSLSFVHPETGVTYGHDSLDALINTLDFLSMLIRGSEDDGLVVCWQKEGDHAGVAFPMTEAVKWKQVPPGYKGDLPPGLRK